MTTSADRHRAEPRLGRAGAVSPQKLAHVVLRSADIEAARDWYVDVLGCEVMFDGGFLCFLSYDDEHHRVALVSVPDAPSPDGHTGLEHVAFTYAGLGDLVATYRRLAARGITPHWCINHGPTTSLYYRDPDGNQVELQIDNFDTEAELMEWFRSGAFASNPIGVEFDPDELADKFEAGLPASELIKRDRDQT
jgi:catechol-2,3-dioxygenase